MGNKTQCYVVRAGESKNELCHWKYIKREKRPNGKWRYYYDVKELKKDVGNALGADEKERLETAKREYDSYDYNTDDLELALKRSRDRANDAQKRYGDAKYYSDPNNPSIKGDDPGKVAALRKISNSQLNKLLNEAQNEWDKQQAGSKAIANYAKAQKDYDKTVMGVIESAGKKLTKGRNYISRLLSIH